MLCHVKPLPGWYQSENTMIDRVKPMEPAPSDQLYHIILTTSHLGNDPNNQVEKLRIVGTYTSLATAKAAAHHVPFEAGYESEMFKVYETKPKPNRNERYQRAHNGMVVHAEAGEGTTFEVGIMTTPNNLKLTIDLEDGRVARDLYYVVQTNIPYDDNDGSERVHNIEGSFTSYEDASGCARQVLLDANDGLNKDSYAEYDEAEVGEKDCGYGENVLVHAVGNDGENCLISVVQGQVLESVRLAEAAMRIR